MDAQKLWKTISEDLQVSISPVNYGTWIKTLKATEVREVGDRLILEVQTSSTYHQNTVEQRFYGQIVEAANRISGKKCELKFNINTSLPKTPSKTIGPLFEQLDRPDETAYYLHKHGLREDFVFETFAVSSSNEMAYAAAKAVADSFGKAYNPLFLYGGVGVGKTHLMQSIAIDRLKRNPKTSMIFCMGEEFTNEIIDAIQQKTTREFKRRYRLVQGLFIDDIQFIAGKTTVQEEFFHTFNAILKAGGQVVLTSDRPPHEIKFLEARLRSRFEAGLIVDIGKPDFELRSAIVLIKAKQRKINLSTQDAQLIAANVETARKIEGFLTKLANQALFRKQEVTSELVAGLLGKAIPSNDQRPPPLRPMEILRGVSEYFHIKAKALQGPMRKKEIVTPRHLAMYLMRVDYKLPLTEIGSLFSGRDHTSIMHAVDKIANKLKDSSSLRTDLESLRGVLYRNVGE